MLPAQAKTAKELTNVWNAAVAAFTALAKHVSRGKVNGDLTEVQALLEALPLSSVEFCRVSNNLRNAERYMRSQEWGAASYELRMIAGAVRACLLANGTGVSRPRRKRSHPELIDEHK